MWRITATPGPFALGPPPDYDLGSMPPYEVGSAADKIVGQEVEGYRIVRPVGHGGMGAVYEAFHENIGQRAAVKVLFSEFSDDAESVGRFIAEARAASQVRHAGLVKIFNHGRLPDGTAYIMMEFLAGESLRDRLRKGQRLPLADVLRIAQQIASALSAVHKEGIVHRDLKPANLILVADPEVSSGERIKVVDFGIAKFDSGVTTEIGKTTVGRFLGTALYASPEQCQMAGNVDHRADVYSLGVILYEMIAGHPPFQAAQPGIVIGMHLLVPPPPLYDAAPGVPPQVHQLVHHMLEKDPAKRPTMDQVLFRLGSIKLDGYHLPWWLLRHRGAAARGLLVLALGGGTYWGLRHDSVPRPGQVAPVTPPDMAPAPLPDLRQPEPPMDASVPPAPDLAAPPRQPAIRPPRPKHTAKQPADPHPAETPKVQPTQPPDMRQPEPPKATETKPANKHPQHPQVRDEDEAVH